MKKYFYIILFSGIIIFIYNVYKGLDSFECKYENVSEARSNQMFDRGWIPLFIEEINATKIEVNYDIDTNFSFGNFSVSTMFNLSLLNKLDDCEKIDEIKKIRKKRKFNLDLTQSEMFIFKEEKTSNKWIIARNMDNLLFFYFWSINEGNNGGTL